MQDTLFYVHDPMCSWCWGFEPTRRVIFDAVAEKLQIRSLVGGLAADTDLSMPEPMRQMLQQTWQRIEQAIPGTCFNFEFWEKCSPRRSTYPANRAVIAARNQGDEFDQKMITRIQQAYYLEARNPSDNDTLIELAAEIGLDSQKFSKQLVDASTHQLLLAEIQESRQMGMDSFPSLAVYRSGELHHIDLNYTDPQSMIKQIKSV
ncbi:MAG: DsbA family protein [SAR86 cluster bacterium]|uniref:DsbA family protein n=1 Tax=SAR86 cluster bacterium TaxID=2030880 RepID=A0A2A5CE90_9GAMM|nr:DsbA family protein [Gammaproteobacteria bacterium AH-315-E17]PCJ41848.1 MAG: DsbA family protein [SAR86 cluster bacterium]